MIGGENCIVGVGTGFFTVGAQAFGWQLLWGPTHWPVKQRHQTENNYKHITHTNAPKENLK